MPTTIAEMENHVIFTSHGDDVTFLLRQSYLLLEEVVGEACEELVKEVVCYVIERLRDDNLWLTQEGNIKEPAASLFPCVRSLAKENWNCRQTNFDSDPHSIVKNQLSEDNSRLDLRKCGRKKFLP